MSKGLKVVILLVVLALIVWGVWALVSNNDEVAPDLSNNPVITSADDLEGLTVAAVINYTGDFIVTDMYDEGSVAYVLRATTPANAVMELMAGRVDAVVLDSATAAALVALNEGLVIVEDTVAFSNENYGIAINKDNTELLTAVDAILEQMIASGYIEQIVTRFTVGGELTDFVVDGNFDVTTINDGYLIMGTNAAFPPFEFRSDAEYAVDGVAGVDVEIAKVIASALGLTLRVVDMEFGAIILSLQSNEIDLGIAGMTIRPDRAELVNFSIPYYTASQVIIARAFATN